MTRAAEALIDLDALRHNLRAVRVATSGRRVMAVIKANAYGHGIVDVARALHESEAFADACLDAAMTLRAAGIAQLIVLLEGIFSAGAQPHACPGEGPARASLRARVLGHGVRRAALAARRALRRSRVPVGRGPG